MKELVQTQQSFQWETVSKSADVNMFLDVNDVIRNFLIFFGNSYVALQLWKVTPFFYMFYGF